MARPRLLNWTRTNSPTTYSATTLRDTQTVLCEIRPRMSPVTNRMIFPIFVTKALGGNGIAANSKKMAVYASLKDAQHAASTGTYLRDGNMENTTPKRIYASRSPDPAPAPAKRKATKQAEAPVPAKRSKATKVPAKPMRARENPEIAAFGDSLKAGMAGNHTEAAAIPVEAPAKPMRARKGAKIVSAEETAAAA
jgi:hypothetical protein